MHLRKKDYCLLIQRLEIFDIEYFIGTVQLEIVNILVVIEYLEMKNRYLDPFQKIQSANFEINKTTKSHGKTLMITFAFIST